MKKLYTVAAVLALAFDASAHPGAAAVEACNNHDIADEWSVYHPVGATVPPDRNLSDGASLAVTYDPRTKTFSAELTDTRWELISEPVLELKCGAMQRNAVLAMWVKDKSDGDPKKLCVEKVRSDVHKSHRPVPQPSRDQIGTFMVGIGEPCRSYHGDERAEQFPASAAGDDKLAPTNPGHSHADN